MTRTLSLLVVLLLPLGHVLHAEDAQVLTGIDVLVRDDFRPLRGQRIGLITNHTGLDRQGRTTIDLLAESDQVQLARLFSPEHGMRGELDQSVIDDSIDQQTGLPIVSLYGERRQPTAEQLEGLDTLVFDIQDIGCRFYTYISTMKLAMQAAGASGVRFVVLDRPNPLGGVAVEGPMRDPGQDTFVACHRLPVRHGMTVGELARLFDRDESIPVELEVIMVEGWRRHQTWDQTGLLWTNPSPNMRRLTAALLYPGVGLLETTNLSVGRGTDTPFELIGAPWIDPIELAATLNAAPLPGVRAVPRRFTPTSGPHAGVACGGVDLLVFDARAIRSVETGLLLAHALRKLYPEDWDTTRLPRLLVNKQVMDAVVRGASPGELVDVAERDKGEFMARRQAVLLYP